LAADRLFQVVPHRLENDAGVFDFEVQELRGRFACGCHVILVVLKMTLTRRVSEGERSLDFLAAFFTAERCEAFAFAGASG
jgi:hypothetical protein